MVINEKKISTYYQDLNCETCGALTDYGEAIAIRAPKPTLYADDTIRVDINDLFTFKRVCPKCYKAIVSKKAIAQVMRR